MALTAEQRFKKAVRRLWSRGIYPGPTALNKELHGHSSNHLGGKQPQWRREVMRELGIPLQRKPRDFHQTEFERALASARAMQSAFRAAFPEAGHRKIDL